MSKVVFNERQAEKIEIIIDFLIKFNLLAIPLYILMAQEVNLGALQEATAWISFAFLRTMGYTVLLNGNIIQFEGANLTSNIIIENDCTGWKSIYAFISLMLASPVKKKDTESLLKGVFFIYSMNIVRIISTISLSNYLGLEYLDTIHSFLWRFSMISIVLVTWLTWMRGKKILSDKNQTIFRRLIINIRKHKN